MFIYICLLLIVPVLSFMSGSFRSEDKKRKFFIFSFSFLLFLLFVLRDYSVGRDLHAYKDVYDIAGGNNWFDVSWIYMEPGYVFLMKLGSYLGLSFRLFLCFCYLVIIIPLAFYIHRYSKDIALSIIIYICLHFFIFNMSGLRQSMAMSLCLTAFMIAQRNGLTNFVLFTFFVVLAALIHKSAYVFLPAYFIMRIPLSGKLLFLYLVLAIIGNIQGFAILQSLQEQELTSYEYNEALTIGPSFFMLLCFLFLSFILSRKESHQSFRISNMFSSKSDAITLSIGNYANVLAVAILVLATLSGSVLMRAATYYEPVFLILIPELLSRASRNSRLYKMVFIIIMLGIFYFTVLVPNQFDIIPYKIASDL
ncbi:EpsG family protein [uncultured Bacteroides sp.]|uniref:EpsG family protein n=1 Tax=uncultured Bacteroides sp. TaxID=162156 RepID=UPI002AAB8774|nr:EpsG family protein [uncultured Bacteroides sp.]